MNNNSVSEILPFEVGVKKEYTFKSPYPQRFSLPRDTINFIITNPSSPKGFQKLIQTCKYFFSKNPIVVIEPANVKTRFWCFYAQKNLICGHWENFERFTCKFWFSGILDFKYLYIGNCLNVSKKLFRCHTFIARNADYFYETMNLLKNFNGIKIVKIGPSPFFYQPQGKIMPVEKIFEIFPNVEEFSYEIKDKFSYTKKTVETMIKCPHFKNLKSLTLYYIPKAFDFKTFSTAMRKHNKTNFCLSFNPNIPLKYKNELQGFVDEIIEIYLQNSYPPWICFDGIEGAELLQNMRNKYRKINFKRIR